MNQLSLRTVAVYLSICMTMCCTLSWSAGQKLSSDIVHSPKKIKQYLRSLGFQKINLAGNDAFVRITPGARRSIILSEGIGPGENYLKLASYIPLLPYKDSNIILYQPSGSKNFLHKLLTIGHHGTTSSQDVITAVRYLHTKNKTAPVYIIGLCGGSFDAIHATATLQKTDPDIVVKGLVLNAAYLSHEKLINDVGKAALKKHLPGIVAIPSSLMYQALVFLLLKTMGSSEDSTNVEKQLPRLNTKITFIHGQSDAITPAQPIIDFIKKQKQHDPEKYRLFVLPGGHTQEHRKKYQEWSHIVGQALLS